MDYEFYEPLEQTAPLTRRLAETFCRPVDGTPACFWYHGIWPYLRLFGVAAAPERDGPFFLDALGALAATDRYPRVLVSGAADYSMLAHVVRAYRARPPSQRAARAPATAPEATVIDRCETPTVLCRWYGELVGLPVATATTDVLDYDPGRTFDVICTHSFLSQFPPPARPSLLARWHALLRPGGKVVTTTRIAPGAPDGPQVFTPALTDSFCDQVRAEAERRAAVLEETPQELAEAARRYAERIVAHPTRSVHDVAALFGDAGFVLERLDVRQVAGSLGGSGAGGAGRGGGSCPGSTS
ncbi:MAG: class I SAM-dependent methyltransferase [Actinobacteria bacterium]|nr:class I SAM-dependent methyltransferase [Actinomycetota bacterium]